MKPSIESAYPPPPPTDSGTENVSDSDLFGMPRIFLHFGHSKPESALGHVACCDLLTPKLLPQAPQAMGYSGSSANVPLVGSGFSRFIHQTPPATTAKSASAIRYAGLIAEPESFEVAKLSPCRSRATKPFHTFRLRSRRAVSELPRQSYDRPSAASRDYEPNRAAAGFALGGRGLSEIGGPMRMDDPPAAGLYDFARLRKPEERRPRSLGVSGHSADR